MSSSMSSGMSSNMNGVLRTVDQPYTAQLQYDLPDGKVFFGRGNHIALPARLARCSRCLNSERLSSMRARRAAGMYCVPR